MDTARAAPAEPRGPALRLLLAGGGSGGSVTPLLAVAAELRAAEPDVELLFLGTRDGPERDLALAEGITYVGIPAGKLRRYWDIQNITDIGRVLAGYAQSLGIIRRFAPAVALGAGGFASVPPLAAARTLGVPILIHQQDVEPGLANRLLIPFATRITVSLPASLPHFPTRRTIVTGNPVRPAILAGRTEVARELFGLEPGVPIVLVTGGGTGALALNALVAAAAPALTPFCQVLHLTGRGRGVPPPAPVPRYHALEFLTVEMPHVLAAADLVVGRAGMGTLTELAALAKPALIIPMPRSHQLANAAAFEQLGAVEVVRQETLTPAALAARITALLEQPDRRAQLAARLHASMPLDAAARIAALARQLATARRPRR